MKEYQSHKGGRHLVNEDIKNLQSLALSAAELFRGSTINFVISGCAISDGKLSAGYVWLDGKVREVAAADISGLSFPLYIYPVDKESSMRMVYLDGTTGPQYFEYGTALTDDASSLSGSYIECESATRGFPGIEQWFPGVCLGKERCRRAAEHRQFGNFQWRTGNLWHPHCRIDIRLLLVF